MTTFEREIRQRVEFIPNRLYYVSLSKPPPPVSSDKYFFSIDKKMIYWNFYLDFGPLNLGHVMNFKNFLKEKLANPSIKTIYFYSSMAPEKRANAAFLICAFMLLEYNKTAHEAFRYFKNYPYSFPNWHDATVGACPFVLTILDTLMGLEKAKQLKFFDYENFNQEEYEYYEQIEHGDLNWYVNKKFIAFAGPHEEKVLSPGGYQTNTPEDYIPYFKKNNVQLVVRLNHPCYNAQKFVKNGIDHIDLIFTDGSNPPSNILAKFLKKCEDTPGAIAVHCKAGLGRTGTCVACYMMKHYRLTAEEVIGWMRIVRPGSVIGPQQQFLKDIQNKMWKDGDLYRTQLQANNSVLNSPSATTMLSSPISSPVPNSMYSNTATGPSPTHNISQSSPLSRTSTPSGISRPQLSLSLSDNVSNSRPTSSSVTPRSMSGSLTPPSSTLSNTGALSLTPRSSGALLNSNGSLTPTNSSSTSTSRPTSRGAFTSPVSKPSSFIFNSTSASSPTPSSSSPNTTHRPLNLNSFSNSNGSSSRPLSRGRTSSGSSTSASPVTPSTFSPTPNTGLRSSFSVTPSTPIGVNPSSSDYDGSQGDQLRARRYHNSQTSTPVNPNTTQTAFSPNATTSSSPYGNFSHKLGSSVSTPSSPNTSGKFSSPLTSTSVKKTSSVSSNTASRSPYSASSPTRSSLSSNLDSTTATSFSNRLSQKIFGMK